MSPRERRLETALRDVLACFADENPSSLITFERIEAWRAALEEPAKCALCGAVLERDEGPIESLGDGRVAHVSCLDERGR